MANAVIPSKLLRIGVDEPLYVSPAGAINTAAQMGTFGIAPQSSVPRGTLWLEAVPVGATGGTGALTVSLVASFDGGTTFQPVTGATGLALVTAGVGTIVSVNVSGLGGNGQLALLPTTVTIGT